MAASSRSSTTEQATTTSPVSVNIRPGVTMLGVLTHLQYRAWYALAEYVDNAIQSFLSNKTAIVVNDGEGTRLAVRIEVDSSTDRIIVRDNAAGIPKEEFPRAFRPAETPPDTSGLSEFGMGMKSASCWFAPRWRVRTTALGDPVCRTVTFDIEEIVTDRLEELDVHEEPADSHDHYTVIELLDVRNLPTGRTSGKIKEHLSDIYREFLRSEELELWYRGEQLLYEEPEVLNAPAFNSNNEPEGESCEWRKDINFDLGDGLRVRGFAALRSTGSTKYAGFSLFRRRRVIEGSGDEKYRPPSIFGSSNAYAYQRLFGELHLEGFEVSHTKEGFRWDDNEEPFLELLKEHLDSDKLPLLRQARNYRERVSRATVRRMADNVTRSTGEALEHHLPGDVTRLREIDPPDRAPASDLPHAEFASRRQIDVDFSDERWRVVLELTTDPSVHDWISLAESVVDEVDGDGRHLLGVRMSLVHPFIQRFARMDQEHVEPLVRLAAAIGLAEKLARDAGGDYPTAVRMNLNELLRGALAQRDIDQLEGS